MRPGRAVALASVALALGAVALALAGPDRPARAGLVAAAKQVVGYPAWLRRSWLREEPPFSRLAASQVGYAPSMEKEFTSPRPFRSFTVVDERSGEVALRGQGPGRRIATDVLGPITEVWVGDFSSLRVPGRYRVVTDDGLRSHPFDVGPGVFDAPVRAVQRAFYFQRAFTAVKTAYAEGPWVHDSDAGLAPPGEVGGWHDAGDFSLYSASTTSALFWLLSAWSDFRPPEDDLNLPESGNGLPDLLDEIRWGLGWLLSVQEPSGGFRNTTCQEHYGWYGANAPERVAPYRAGEVGTLATARAVGTLAFAAAVFRDLDLAFAARCLEAARRGQARLDARPGEHSDGPTCPAMRQDGDAEAGRGARMYAAAGLLLATGEARHRQGFEAWFQEIDNDPSYQRSNVYAALLYLRAPAGDPARQQALRARLRARAEGVLADGQAHPFRWATRYLWGSIGAGFQRSGAFNIPLCLAAPDVEAAHCRQALDNVHYTLGRNLLQLSYVSGLPGVTHGRTHAFHHWLATLDATPFLFPGMVAGGPMAAPVASDGSFPRLLHRSAWGYWGDPAMPRSPDTPLDGRYTDNDSWSTNEMDIEWQAVTLYSLHFARWWARAH